MANLIKTVGEIHELYTQNPTGSRLTPVKSNNISEVPYNRLVYHIDRLGELSECIAIDKLVVDLIRRKQSPFVDDALLRQEVTLLLMDGGNSIPVKIWVIPMFLEGVMVYHLYAADDGNLDHLRRLRNPAKPGNYDITSL